VERGETKKAHHGKAKAAIKFPIQGKAQAQKYSVLSNTLAMLREPITNSQWLPLTPGIVLSHSRSCLNLEGSLQVIPWKARTLKGHQENTAREQQTKT
jgi:hypothetical protein